MCDSVVLPHPLAPIAISPASRRQSRPTVRVLGQYKPSRDLEPLREIGARFGNIAQLEIFGRGWPAVDGWQVQDAFISEFEFDQKILTADCVVIPYKHFFQSGVGARCLESAVPVVGPNHEHLIELFGSDWPGLVSDGGDWAGALRNALEADREILASEAARRREELHKRWTTSLIEFADSAP